MYVETASGIGYIDTDQDSMNEAGYRFPPVMPNICLFLNMFISAQFSGVIWSACLRAVVLLRLK